MSNPRIELAQILLKGFDDVAFPAALRESLMDVITKSDDLSADLTKWQDDITSGRNANATEAAVKLLENPAFVARLNAVPHMETLARNFDEAMMSTGPVDLDGMVRQFDINTSLSSSEMDSISKLYTDRLASRQQRVADYMTNNNLSRTDAEERFAAIYKVAVDRIEARRLAEAGNTGPATPTNTAANAVENATPNPNATPTGTGAVDGVDNAADDLADDVKATDEGTSGTGAADNAADEAAENTANSGASPNSNAASGTPNPQASTTVANGFIPQSVKDAVSWTWNSKLMTPVRFMADPIIKFASDAAITARYLPGNYTRRGLSWRFNDHEATKGFFKRTDTYKTTNSARLSMDINASRAIKNDDAGNFVYKNGTTGVADDLTGAINNVKTRLDEAHSGAQTAIDDLADGLQTASDEIAEAAEQLKQADILRKEETLLNKQADRFERLTTNMDTGAKPDYTALNKSLEIELSGTSDPETARMLQEAINKLESTRNANLDGATEHAQATKVFIELSNGLSSRADVAGSQVQKMSDAADSIIRRHQRTIMDQAKDGHPLTELNQASEALDANINRISSNIADIEAPPPTTTKERLVGGSVTARLSAHKVKPHLEDVREFSDNLRESTQKIEDAVDLDGLASSFNDAIASASSTKIDDLLALSETLSNKSNVIRGAADLDGQLSSVGDAIDSVRKMDEIAVQYTTVTKAKHWDLFAANANTGMQIAQDVGRVEMDVAAKHRREFRQLVQDGKIELDIPTDPETGKPAFTLNDIIRWEGNENIMNAHRGEGNDGIFMRSEPQKFMEYALVYSKDVDKALLNAEVLLKEGDTNRFWEAMKWGSAGTFARNTDEFGVVTPDIARAPNQALLTRFYDKMREYSRTREADKGSSAFTDRIERSTADFKTSVDALGANTYRQTWRDMYIRTRNVRYKGDFDNELNFDVDLRAVRRKMTKEGKTKEEIDTHIRNMGLDSEYRGAKEWAEGTDATSRHGMRAYRRPFLVMPKQIWANLPYRKTHFDGWKRTRQTLFEFSGLSRYVYPAAAVGAYAGYKAIFGEKDWTDERRTEALVAEDVPQAMDYSEENVDLIKDDIDGLNDKYDAMVESLEDFEAEQLEALDEQLAVTTDASKIAELQNLKSQITQSVATFKNEIADDRRNSLSGLNQTLTQMEMIDANMRGVSDLATANTLLAEQQNYINAAHAEIDAALLGRAETIKTLRDTLEESVENGRPLSAPLTPASIAGNLGGQVPAWVNPNGNTQTPGNTPSTTGINAPAVVTTPGATTTTTPGTTTTTTPGATTTTTPGTTTTTTPGATTTTTPGATTTTTPPATPKPQWQQDLEKNQADARSALSRGNSYATSVDRLISNPNAADGRKLGGTELMAVIAGQVKSLEDLQEEFRNENDIQKAQGMDRIIQAVGVNQQEAFDLLEQIKEINDDLTPLQERATQLEAEIRAMSTLANLGDSQTKLDELNRVTSQIETKMKAAQQLYDGIKAEGDQNSELMNNHDDVKYRYGTAHKIDEALKTVGGGEFGLPYQIFGRGESGVMSVAGGYASLAFNKVKEFGNWWGDVKRNASTQSERNWLNGIEAGAGIFGSLVAINMINKYAFGGNMPTAVKWGAILFAAAYFIHRTGQQGAGQAHARSGSSPFAQSNYGGASSTTNHTPATVNGTSTTQNTNSSTSQGTENTSSATEVPITDRNGNAVTHVIYEGGQVTSGTVQSHAGGLPTSAQDIVVSAEAAAIIQSKVEMRSDQIRSNILGRGGNVPDELRGNVDVLFNDKDGNLIQRVDVDFTVEGNPAELADPAQQGGK